MSLIISILLFVSLIYLLYKKKSKDTITGNRLLMLTLILFISFLLFIIFLVT